MHERPVTATEYERADRTAVLEATDALFCALTCQGGEVAEVLARPPDDTAEVLKAVRELADKVDAALRAAREEWDRVAREAGLRRKLFEQRQRLGPVTDIFPSIENGGETP